MMDYQPCPKRLKLTIIDQNGDRQQVLQCTEPKASAFAQFVSVEVCADCPLRLVALEAETRMKPAKVDPTPQAAAVAVAGFQDCVDRKPLIIVKCCGEVTHKQRCQNDASPNKGLVVAVEDCNVCSVRRPASKKIT